MKMKKRGAHAFPQVTTFPVDNWLARAHLFNRPSIHAHRNEKLGNHQQKSCYEKISPRRAVLFHLIAQSVFVKRALVLTLFYREESLEVVCGRERALRFLYRCIKGHDLS